MKSHLMWPCLTGIALAVALVWTAGPSSGTVGTAMLVLACPVMMFVMMRFMGKSHGDDEQPRVDAHDSPTNERRDAP